MDAQHSKQAILRKRAEKLAKESPTIFNRFIGMQIVCFGLANEQYAIESKFVREICPLKNITPLPGAPSFVQGLINVRSQIISVIDLKILFEINTISTSSTYVIILEKNNMKFGIAADILLENKIVDPSGIQTTFPGLTDLKQAFFKGVFLDKMILLDGEKLLTDNRIVIDEQVE